MKMFEALTRAGEGVLERVVERMIEARFDAWYNGVTGFGTDRDKTTYGSAVAGSMLTLEELDALYNYNDMAASIVDIVPDDVYGLGFTVLTGSAELDEVLKDKLDALAAADRLADGMRWGRAYGGGAVLIGADDGRDASQPLAIERAEDIRYLYDFDRRVLFPRSYYSDFGNPKIGQPETYLVWNQAAYGGSQIVVHESRLILFGGATTARQEKLLNETWDLSVLQRPHEVLRQFDTGWKSVEILLTDAHQAVMKMSGLADIIAAPGGMQALQRRATLTDMYRSVLRAIIVDADSNESLDRQQVSFESIPQTLEKVMIRMSAAAGIPVTRLMGQSPAGLSATGESDLRWHFNRMESERTRRQEPRVRRLVQLWLQTRAGKKAARTAPKSLTVKWPSLWSESPLDEATRRKTIAESDQIYVTTQVFTPDEVALIRGRPEGYDKDIVLTAQGLAARERALAADLQQIGGAADEGTPLELTPTDIATITKVNEARASVGLMPLPEPDGSLTLPEFKEKYAATIAAAAVAETGQTESPEAGDDPARFDATKTFKLHRDEDETGVSGTGIVAEGIVFSDGSVVLKWLTATSSTTLFRSVDEMLKVHGHAGKTRIVYD